MTRTELSVSPQRLALFESRFALRVTAQLGQAAELVGPDISERLRVAREQAVERSRAARLAAAPAASRFGRSGGAAVLGGGTGWRVRIASILPLVALVGGLMLIHEWHLGKQVTTAAEIDADLLADDLPPGAYSDPGFVEFLKTPPRD